MPNLADITTLNSTNAPRLLRAVFVLERDLFNVPSPDDTSTIRQEISLSANAESYALYHTRETEQFTERKEVTAAGKRYEQTLRLNVPRSRAAIDAVLDAIGTNKVAVAFVDRNGAARLVRRLRLQHELTIASGNGYQLTFAGESKTFAAYLTQNVFDALAGDAEYIDEEDVVTEPDPMAIGEKLFVWYSAATAATYAATRDWYIDLGTSSLNIAGDVRLTDLETGTDAGVVAYDANNRLLRSDVLRINANSSLTAPEIIFANGTRKTRILDGAIEFERLNGGGYPNYIRANRTNGNYLEINARARVNITTNTNTTQASFNESQNGIAHQFPFYGQGNLQSGADAYITAFSSTGDIKESSAIKLLGNNNALTIGHNVPYDSQSYYTVLGHNALINSTNARDFLTILGASAGSTVTGVLFRQSTIIGNAAVFGTANNVYNSVIIGEQAAQRAGYIGSVVIGYRAGYFATGDRPFTNVIAIGDQVVPEKDNQIIIGKTNTTEFKTYGALVLPSYGTGAITGTPSTFSAFEADGKLIEYTLQDFFALVPAYDTNTAAAAVLAVGETYYNTTTATYTKVI